MPRKLTKSSTKKQVVKDIIENTEYDIYGGKSESELEEELETDAPDYEENYSDEEVEDEDNLDDNNEVGEEEEEPKDEQNEDCFYNYIDNSDDEIFEDEELEEVTELKELIGDERQTKPIFYYDEKVRLIGDRSLQLATEAKCMIKGVENLTNKEKAELEIKHKVCPLLIRRYLPNGYYERWHIRELKEL